MQTPAAARLQRTRSLRFLEHARCLMLWLTMFLCGEASAQFDYTNVNGAITITGYHGSGGDVTVPGSIDGLPVTAIGNSGYSFAVGDNTWHSADKVGSEVTTRDSILLTYFVDSGVLRFLRNRGKRIGNFFLNEFRRVNGS